MRRNLLAAALACTLAAGAPGAAAASCPHGRTVLAPPPAGTAYLAAFPDFSDAVHNEDAVSAARIRAYERLAGRPITWAYFSNHWLGGRIRFPLAAVRTILGAGRTPFIRMMPWSRQLEDVADPVFRWRDIADGRWDAALRRWASAARRVRAPLLVDLGVEVNGRWFPWNPIWQGRAAGAAAFRAAYRHVVALFRRQGACNVTWFFHADAEGDPVAAWNTMRALYPGDDVVDWVGLSDYGAVDRTGPLERFGPKLRRGLAELARATRRRPIAILELGASESPRWSKPWWIRDAFRSLARLPQVRAASWWHETWEDPDGPVSTRIDSSPASLAAFRRAVASPRLVTRPRFRSVR